MHELTTQKEHAINAHEFLIEFLNKFDGAQRGGIHDFIEITLFNMINSGIKDIDNYLSVGHKKVIASEIMIIFTQSCQKILDNIKRNLEDMERVDFR